MRYLYFCVAPGLCLLGVAVSANAGVPVGLSGGGTAISFEEQWERVNRIVPVTQNDFAQVDAIHRQMLANMAESIERVEAVGEEPLVPNVCFSPGAPWETVALFNAFASRGQKFQGTDNGRWSQTFTDGGGLQQGDPITLRVSFPPDGVSLVDTNFTGFGENDTPNNLNAMFNAAFGNAATWKGLVESVFDDWSARSGIDYVFDVNDNGSSFPDTPGSNGCGDIRIAGHSIDGDPPSGSILAYNYGPDFGDMVIDTDNTGDFTSAGNNFRLLRNTLSHEHGHGLGFAHVCPLNNAIVMEPFITTAFDHSAEDDIRHANRKYGDAREKGNGNDSSANATLLGVLNVGTGDAGDFLSIDSIADQDFYRVTTTAPRVVNITLSPTGTLYQEGAQGTVTTGNPTGCTGSVLTNTNGRNVMNLRLEVRASNAVTVLASSTSGGLGVNEAIENLFLPGNGTFFVRVYTNDGAAANVNTQVQMYSLDFEVESGAAGTLQIRPSTPAVSADNFFKLSAVADGFSPAAYLWRRNGSPISTETGSELEFARITEADSGQYTVEADDGSKTLVVSPPYNLHVFPVGSLPVGGVVGIAALALGLALAGARRARK